MLSEYIKYSKFNPAGRRSSVNSISQEKCIHGLAVFFFGDNMKICECGCGQEIVIQKWHKRKGIPRFINYHYLRTEEWKQKMNKIGSGKNNPMYGVRRCGKDSTNWKGGLVKTICEFCNKEFYIKPSRIKIGIGKFCSYSCRSKALNQKENHPNWQGGITPIFHIIRNSMKFKLWRKAIFIRDDWTCQICNKKGIHLHPHHIWNFALFAYLRFNIDNGVTLCKDCHFKLHGNNKKGVL